MSTPRTPLPPTLTATVLAATVLTVVVLTATGCSWTRPVDTTAHGGIGATTDTVPAAPAASGASLAGSGVVQPERRAPVVPTGVDPATAGVDRTSIDTVATAVVTALNTADTRTDTGPNDAAARTVGLLTADYAAAVVTTPPLRSAGARWTTWTTQGVQLTATVEALPDDRPADTATTATRLYLVTQTPTTATGQVLDAVVTVAYIGLRRVAAGWAVAQVAQR
jgi:hypothetical protein